MRTSKRLGIKEVITGRLDNGAYLCKVNLPVIMANGFDQSLIDQFWLNKVKSNFDREFVDTPKIVRYTDRLSIFDGRMSAQLLADKGITECEAFVWENWDENREATAYYISKQFKRKLAGWNRFDKAVKAGMPTENQIFNLINKMRLTTPYNVHREIADLPRCGIVMDVFERGREPLLKQWLTVMKNWKIDGVIPETAKSFNFGRALAQALFVQEQELVDKLKYIHPDEIRQDARKRTGRQNIDEEQFRKAMIMLAFFR